MSEVSHDFPGGPILEQRLLPSWLPMQRWFRSKSRALDSVAIEAWARLDEAHDAPLLTVARVTFRDGSLERYILPIAPLTEAQAARLPSAARIGVVETENGPVTWYEATTHPDFHHDLYALLSGERERKLGGGLLAGAPISPDALRTEGRPTAKVLSAEQSNTSFAWSNGYFAKLYRRLEAAVNPEPETLRYLREAGYPHVPAFASSLEWRNPGEAPVTVAMLQDWVASRGDAWTYALEQLRAAKDLEELPPAFLLWSAALGRRVAGLHNALAAGSGAFAAEPLLAEDLERVRAGARAGLRQAFASLEDVLPRLDAGTAALARRAIADRGRLEARLEAGREDVRDAVKTRTHGDLHLGQILVSAADPGEIWILDFEGEPGRPLAEARRKHPPARDAAGMLRSFHYAAHAALREPAQRPRAEAFAAALSRAFREAYLGALRVPSSSDPGALVEIFMLEKAVYELNYELNNRPDWAGIPLLGLQQLVTK